MFSDVVDSKKGPIVRAFGPTTGPWQSIHPREAYALFRDLEVRWWVAGGWALDLYLGRQSRPHKDLDIGIQRRDAGVLIAALNEWEFFEAKDGQLYGPITDKPRADINSLWGRPAGADRWVLELMLDESAGDDWVFRRNHTIRRPFWLAIRAGPDGLPYIAPEIQLLYKANRRRSEDEADFELVRPYLTEEAADWLRSALTALDLNHSWLVALSPRP